MSSTDASDPASADVDDTGRVRWPTAEGYVRVDEVGVEVWESSTGHRERRSYER